MNSPKIKFDHIYTVDNGHRFHKKLEQLGFKLAPQEVLHPGGSRCRFIRFKPTIKSLHSYLEFIHIEKGGTPIRARGLSLRFLGKLETYFKKIQRKKSIGPSLIHRNYQWSVDAKNRLPGWNFLQFKKPGFKNLYVWFTEYEASRERLKQEKVTRHPNGVIGFYALEIQVNKNSHDFFETIFAKKIEENIKLPSGHRFMFSNGKKTVLKTIVLEAKSIKTMAKRYKVDAKIEWQGRPALLIKNPNAMWDIIIIDKQKEK